MRTLVLSKLRPQAHHVVWDVGAGTGSVSIECALACPAGWVYAVEKEEPALELLEENGSASAFAISPPCPAVRRRR